MYKEQLRFEEMLAYHCAPALKKQKCANMFHIQKHQFPHIEQLIETYNNKFNQQGIHFRLFQCDQMRVTVYVYDPEAISLRLSEPRIQNLLLHFDYPIILSRFVLHTWNNECLKQNIPTKLEYS